MVKSKAQISWSNRQSFQQAINSLLYLEANGIIFIPEWMWANLNPIARYQLATNFPKQTRDRLRELTAALRTPRKLTLTCYCKRRCFSTQYEVGHNHTFACRNPTDYSVPQTSMETDQTKVGTVQTFLISPDIPPRNVLSMKTSSASKSHSPSTVEGERKTTSTKRWPTGQQTRKRG